MASFEIPVEWRCRKHALGRPQPDRARVVGIEDKARHLELVGQAELRRLLERVGEVSAGVGERDHLRLRRLRLQQEGGEIRGPERGARGSQDLAAELDDLLAGVGLEVLAKGVIRGDEIPAGASARDHRLGDGVTELPRVVGPVHGIGRARLAREVGGARSRRNENLVQIPRQRIHPERDGGVRDIDDHLDAFSFEPAARDRGTDVDLVLVVGGRDLHRPGRVSCRNPRPRAVPQSPTQSPDRRHSTPD